jgi:hypothetical protein
MTLILSGTDGLSDVDGSAATPAIRGADANTGMFFPAADTIAFSEGGAEVARFDASGNLGLGTSSPSSYGSVAPRLVVTGSGRADAWFVGGSSTGAYAYFSNNAQTSTANTMQIGQGWATGSDNIGFLNTNGANPLLFATNGAERMRIDSIGNVRIGTTSNIISGVEKVTIDASGYGYGLVVSTGAAGGFAPLLLRNNDGNATSVQIYFLHQSTFVGSISTTASSTAYNTSSDYRLKENIAPMTGALATVSLLKPVTYKWKADGSSGQGFIAHELAEVVPDAVTGEKDAVETYIDKDGNEQTRIKAQGIDTSFLVATLTAAIQELNAKVETQAAKIAALESK